MNADLSKPFYYRSESFAPDDAPVFHGFFGRRGGHSKGIYDSLNCGAGSDDDLVAVKKNRALVAEAAGILPENLLTLHQIHSGECLTVREVWGLNDRPKADAMVTDVPGLGLGILTADCAPVLFYAAGESPVIGAAHAGWGGALKGVLENTVKAMEGLGAARSNIKACIGPCIGKASYEVSEDFTKPFLDLNEEDERFFSAARREGHLMFDLAGYCAARLYRAGLSRITIKDIDTYFNEADFFSYRRATHRREKDYGRQVSVIAIKP